MQATTRPRSRTTAILAALAMALTMVVAAPGTARAHDSCAVPQPTATGFLASLMSFVNVFSSFLETEVVSCEDKYEDVRAVMDRDWVAPQDAVEPLEATDRGRSGDAPGRSGERGNAPATFAPCVDGMAADLFECDGIDLMSHVSMTELGLGQADVPAFVNDMWGWTDDSTGSDYALLGSTEGTVFVDISDDKRPQVLGILPTASTVGGSSWRDIKVYDDHAFVVSEHTNHGVQVFDLTRLRDWDGDYTSYDADARYTGHGSAHNININTDTGFAYSVGAGQFSSQPQPFSVRVDEGIAEGSYLAGGAGFGATADQAGVEAVFSDMSGSTDNALACSPVTEDLTGTIALVDRGACAFTVKAANVQAAGAVALVVVNSADTALTLGGSSGSILIPAVGISSSDGATIRTGLPASGAVLANDPPSVCGNGLHMIDVSDPQNPTFAGCESETGYVHDTQCVVYDGPDTDYTGRELCFNSNGLGYSTNPLANFFSVVDVTDKSNPVTISRIGYSGSGYSHQGWLTEDQAYFLHGDEGDEQLTGVNTTTRVWDVSDLDDPEVVSVFENVTDSIDHNVYIEGDLAYASNYTSGLRVYDASNPGEGLDEVAWFDLYPENDAATFEGGTWSNYPYFRQKGIVAVSSIDRGLFILRPRGAGNGG